MRTKPRNWMWRLAHCVAVAALIALVGCGVLSARKTDFDAALKTADGQVIYVEDVRAIVDDAQLSPSEQVDALRELGIEDDDLIQALLTLP